MPSCSSPVYDDEFDIDVLTVLVKEVGHEVSHRLVRDVAAQDDVPEAATTSYTTSPTFANRGPLHSDLGRSYVRQ